jgi:S-DNA-T family DNA segregation ATPase FtsK/SpoIIIE
VPLTGFVVGSWLIARHFGDTPPSVDPIRVVGGIIAFVALLIIFQYIHSFNYPADTTPGLLEIRLEYAWQVERAGGGAIGASLYYFLIRNVTEIGGFFVLVFLLLIAGMLVTRSSASQMLTTGLGMARNFRESLQQRAAAQRARRQLEMEQRAQAAQAAAQAAVPSSPATPAAQAAAPAEAPPRDIRINRGIVPGAALAAPAVPSAAPVAAPAPAAASGGFLSRIRGGSAPAAPSPAPSQGASGGLFGRFARSAPQEPAPPPLLQPLPLEDAPVPSPITFSSASALNGLADEAPAARPLESAFSPYERPARPAAATPYSSPLAAALGQDDDDDEALDEDSQVLMQRANRLNALRAGQTAPPAAEPPTLNAAREPLFTPPATSPAAFTPPSQLPSAQPSAQPGQQNLSIPLSSPVVNQTRAQRPQWKIPDYRTLLSTGSEQELDRELLLRQAKIIEETLSSFGAPGRVVEVNTGPVITQFGVEPDYVTARGKKQRVKVGAIAALDKDLQLALGAKSIRVEAPVPGKGYVGIEVPNKEPTTVRLRDVMESTSFTRHKSPLAIALGQSVSGAPVSADLAAMPHLLIAGTTGSGKSVMVNAIIASILARNTPDQVKFIMVDPKRVELTGYNGIPHLVAPVVVELERIVGVLKWVTREMDDRYRKFSDAGARNIEDYNKHLDDTREPLAYIIVIIDELADLMMLAPEETERTITRIAALARATGIHLVIATQRPSVDVVTGLIKANFPARIAFAVAGGVDSRVILDQPGAERLLGRGDMLYLSGDSPAPQRLQGVFVSDMEINNLTRYWKMQAVGLPEAKPFNTTPLTNPAPATPTSSLGVAGFAAAPAAAPAAPARPTPSTFWDVDSPPAREEDSGGDSDDDLYEQAVELVRRLDKASVSLLQRRLRIGYTRAARLIDMMEARGVVGPAKDGSSKPRDVLPLSAAKKKP